LTLSACETGIGEEYERGAEIEGFGVMAQKQGARAVLATLWNVADGSTGRLMREFYRLRASAPGMTKAEALQQAQLSLLRGPSQKGEPGTRDRSLSKAADGGASEPGNSRRNSANRTRIRIIGRRSFSSATGNKAYRGRDRRQSISLPLRRPSITSFDHIFFGHILPISITL
jgi:CHAT domain-containing protein